MDFQNKVDLDELTKSYPGHFNPDVSLFSYDSADNSINNSTYENVSHEQCISYAKHDTPENTIQLIRFRALPSESKNPASVEQINKDVQCLVSVFEVFECPLSPIVHARHRRRVELGRHFSGDSRANKAIFYAGGARFCIVWTHSLSTKNTRAVMVNFMLPESEDEKNSDLRLSDILRLLIMPRYQLCFNHPMFLALVVVHMIHQDTLAGYTNDSAVLMRIENSFVTVKSAGRIETMARLRDLGRFATRDKYTLTALQKMLGLARRVNETYYTTDASNPEDIFRKQFHLYADQLYESVDLDVAFLDSILGSISNQQAAVTNIVNLQDGASMKTIAVITMTFLPATFVAAIFAMPMFHWNDDQASLVMRQFWIYWAVVIPLTVLVVLIWLGWWYWRSVRREYDEDTSPLQDFLCWFREKVNRRSATTKRQEHAGGGSIGRLSGNEIQRYEEDLYRSEGNSKTAAWNISRGI